MDPFRPSSDVRGEATTAAPPPTTATTGSPLPSTVASRPGIELVTVRGKPGAWEPHGVNQGTVWFWAGTFDSLDVRRLGRRSGSTGRRTRCASSSFSPQAGPPESVILTRSSWGSSVTMSSGTDTTPSLAMSHPTPTRRFGSTPAVWSEALAPPKRREPSSSCSSNP